MEAETLSERIRLEGQLYAERARVYKISSRFEHHDGRVLLVELPQVKLSAARTRPTKYRAP